jgi:hypothetical protein
VFYETNLLPDALEPCVLRGVLNMLTVTAETKKMRQHMPDETAEAKNMRQQMPDETAEAKNIRQPMSDETAGTKNIRQPMSDETMPPACDHGTRSLCRCHR